MLTSGPYFDSRAAAHQRLPNARPTIPIANKKELDGSGTGANMSPTSGLLSPVANLVRAPVGLNSYRKPPPFSPLPRSPTKTSPLESIAMLFERDGPCPKGDSLPDGVTSYTSCCPSVKKRFPFEARHCHQRSFEPLPEFVPMIAATLNGAPPLCGTSISSFVVAHVPDFDRARLLFELQRRLTFQIRENQFSFRAIFRASTKNCRL